jgi:hypothetical protein
MGRPFRFEVREEQDLESFRTLLTIKLASFKKPART